MAESQSTVVDPHLYRLVRISEMSVVPFNAHYKLWGERGSYNQGNRITGGPPIGEGLGDYKRHTLCNTKCPQQTCLGQAS